MITGKNYIGYNLSAESETTFRTFNPQLNDYNPWTFFEASEKEVAKATTLAKNAFKEFRNTSTFERAKFLKAIIVELRAISVELLQVYCAESGLTNARAKIELKRTLFQLELFADLLTNDEWQGIYINPKRDGDIIPDLRKMKIPLGPVVVFGASNFPLAYSTAGGDTASALAAGCPVIVKSHPMHAGTGEMVAGAVLRAARKTGLPEGVFSNLNSNGFEVGVQLVRDPSIKAVGFTGSITGGRAIFDLANKREEPIPVFAEMGSINPVVISEKSLQSRLDYWTDQYTTSITNGTGQFCTNPGLILALESDALDEFVTTLSKKLVDVESTCMLHPAIKNAFKSNREKILRQIDVHQMTSDITINNENYAEQTVVRTSGAEFLKNKELHNEVFGPFTMVVGCVSLEQLENIIEELEGQLTGTVILEESDWKTYEGVIEALKYRVGRLIINGVPTGVEVCAAMNHGGPYPASTDARFTAVGPHSIDRWLRSITFQNFPSALLPIELI